MTHQFTVSDLGLRLIKAYEGYRAESRKMVSGNAVVGYGHRIADQDVIELTREEAETLLREDIRPVEDLINESIFAPLSQSQFDALCSLAYNIGPDAFLSSNVVKAMNNGRPIDAANEFDVWRKGEIDGQIFVIDALVRRRTAEKALFLKPDRKYATSPRDSLPPVRDDILSVHGRASMPVYTADDAEGFVDQLPYDARPNPGRRREDGPAGILELSEFFERDKTSNPEQLGFVPEAPIMPEIENDAMEGQELSSQDNSDTASAEMPLTLSPIAEVAAEVSNRLDALIDDFDGQKTDTSDMPDTLLKSESAQPNAVVLPFRGKTADIPVVNDDADINILEPAQSDDRADDVKADIDNSDTNITNDSDSSQRFIDRSDAKERGGSSAFAFGVMLLSGVIMFGLSLYAWFNDPEALLGIWGPIATLTGMIMGGAIILGSIYYILKLSFGPQE